MKTLLSLAAIFFVSLFDLRAELLEYNYSGLATYIGDGRRLAQSYSGVMIYDTVTTNVTFVGWSTNKTFWIHSNTNFHTTTVLGPNSTSYTAIVHSSSGTDGDGFYRLDNYLIKGANKTLTIGTGKTYSFPGTLSGVNNRNLGPHSGVEWLETWGETMLYSSTRTVPDNNNNRSSVDVANALGAWLSGRGYVQH